MRRMISPQRSSRHSSLYLAVTLCNFGPQPDVIVGVIVQLQYRLIYIHRHFFSS